MHDHNLPNRSYTPSNPRPIDKTRRSAHRRHAVGLTCKAIAATWLLLTYAAPLPAASVTIVANPGTVGSIEQAATAEDRVDWWDDNLTEDTAVTESFAAVELRRFLAAVTPTDESEIQLASPDSIPTAGHVFLLGSGTSNPLFAAVDAAGDEFTPRPAESFRIRSQNRDGRVITVIKGRDRVGTLYGVYAYLERLGVRFYGLGEMGTVLPARMPDLPADLDLAGSPHFLTRGFWAWEDRGDPTFYNWMARNRLNLWTPANETDIPLLKKLGIRLIAAHHDVQFYCLNPKAEYPYRHEKATGGEGKPDDPYPVSAEFAGDTDNDGKLSYFEAHPEWYCLRNGTRSDRIQPEFGDNYCTSNPHATAELARNLVQQLIDGRWRHTDVLNFWMLDGGKWCECQACKNQGTYTDRLMIVVDQMLRAIKTAKAEGRLPRDVALATLAYHETLAPPTKPLPEGFDYDNCSVTYFPIERCYAHAIADPACTEVNRLLHEAYEGWTTGAGRHYTGSIFIGEYYNVSGLKSLPVLFTKIMAADIPWYWRTGARHFHYMHTPTRLWGTWTLNQHLMARLLWDIHTDVDQLLDEYFTRFYPTTTEQTRAFYRELEFAMANIKAIKHYVRTSTGTYSLRSQLGASSRELLPLDHLQYEAHHPVLNDGPDWVEIIAAVDRARRLIDDTILTCDDKPELARLMEDERRFAYGEAMMRLYYHLTRAAICHRMGDRERARLAFVQVERQAKILEGVDDLVQVASSHANAKNGMEAAAVNDIYEWLRKEYGTSQPASE